MSNQRRQVTDAIFTKRYTELLRYAQTLISTNGVRGFEASDVVAWALETAYRCEVDVSNTRGAVLALVKNEFRNRLRIHNSRGLRHVDGRTDVDDLVDADADDLVDTVDTAHDVQALIADADLSEYEQRVITLYIDEELKHDEIADKLGKTGQAVRQAFSRAIKKIKYEAKKHGTH